jgi:hypothetical protein
MARYTARSSPNGALRFPARYPRTSAGACRALPATRKHHSKGGDDVYDPQHQPRPQRLSETRLDRRAGTARGGHREVWLHGTPGTVPRDGDAPRWRLYGAAVLQVRRHCLWPEDARLLREAREPPACNGYRHRRSPPRAFLPCALQDPLPRHLSGTTVRFCRSRRLRPRTLR